MTDSIVAYWPIVVIFIGVAGIVLGTRIGEALEDWRVRRALADDRCPSCGGFNTQAQMTPGGWGCTACSPHVRNIEGEAMEAD